MVDGTDQAIVRQVIEGDFEAFGVLVSKYQDRIYSAIRNYVSNPDDAVDITQDAFVKAYSKLRSFDASSAFYTWLYRIAVNTSKKFLLELKRDPTFVANVSGNSDDDDETFYTKNEPTSNENPETMLAAKEVAEAVNNAMQALPEDLRQALVLREIEGLSYEEIALMMACPIGTVRSRIFRARDAISLKVGPLLEHQTGKRW